ncbi:MAG: ABC transporter permease [Chloroflexi bacterium]|nr:ABC transporter permease [Chloroflexota bacterium]
MGRYIVRRLLAAIPVILGVLLLVFVLLRLIPGDPVEVFYYGSDAGGTSNTSVSIDALEQARAKLRLDKSIPEQFVFYIWDVMRLDLGRSFRTKQPITDVIGEQFPSTLVLTMAGMAVTLFIGLVAGVVSAMRHHTWVDYGSQFIAVLGVSVPNFLVGLLLIYIFSILMQDWIPALTLPAIANGNGKELIMPALALGIGGAAIVARLTRSSMLDVMSRDYIRTARSKGVRESTVVWGHALKNALIPVVTIVGLQFGSLLIGAVVIEVVFSRKGIGFTLVKAILTRDYTVVQALVMLAATIYVIANLLVDVLYTYIDPRVRLT